MAQTILIKRSTSTSIPSALANGELAYSSQSGKLFVGRPGGGSGDIDAIGGKYYTDIITAATASNTASKLVLRDSSGNFSAGTITATLTGNVTGNVTGNASGTALSVTQAAQTAITSVGTLTALQVDNLNLNGNTFSATTGAINITPAAGSAIVLDGTINIDAGVLTGATSISSTAFVGTLSTVSQPNITSVGTLTALQVDNINLNGNVLSSTTGNLSITPVSGSTIVLDGTIIVDAGVVTGATSITSTGFTGALTGNATTATTLATARNFSASGDLTAPNVSFNGGGCCKLSYYFSNCQQ